MLFFKVKRFKILKKKRYNKWQKQSSTVKKLLYLHFYAADTRCYLPVVKVYIWENYMLFQELDIILMFIVL